MKGAYFKFVRTGFCSKLSSCTTKSIYACCFSWFTVKGKFVHLTAAAATSAATSAATAKWVLPKNITLPPPFLFSFSSCFFLPVCAGKMEARENEFGRTIHI